LGDILLSLSMKNKTFIYNTMRIHGKITSGEGVDEIAALKTVKRHQYYIFIDFVIFAVLFPLFFLMCDMIFKDDDASAQRFNYGELLGNDQSSPTIPTTLLRSMFGM
jgi:hypothetical protein